MGQFRRTESADAARAAAKIRQLCSLGLGADAILPSLSHALREMIPSFSAMIYTCDRNGLANGFYDTNPAAFEVAPVYFNEFYNAREREVRRGFTETILTFRGATRRSRTWVVDKRTYQRSDFENLVVRPTRYDDFIQLVVYDGSEPRGFVCMPRTYGDREYSDEELRRLAAVEPFLAHGFVKARVETGLTESDADIDTGLLIANREGKIVHLSAQARVLLYHLQNPATKPGRMKAATGVLPPALLQICQSLSEISAGRDAPPPVHKHVNAAGTFVFRAYWLDGVDAATPLIGITLTRLVPLSLRIVRRLDSLPLSARQRETALLIAEGLTYAQIASRLGVSERTVITHAQETFNKLGVQGRAELQAYFAGL